MRTPNAWSALLVRARWRVAIGFVFALALATAARPSPAQTLGDSTITILQEALRENAAGTRASIQHAIDLWNRALPMLARLGMSHRQGVIYNHIGIADASVTRANVRIRC
jgi:hypothetical protein